MARRQKLLLDRYRIIEAIGAGGYGTVQHAYDTRLKRDVAIKSIPLSEADLTRARLLAMEARLAEEAALATEAEADEAAALSALMAGAEPEGSHLPSQPTASDALEAVDGEGVPGLVPLPTWDGAEKDGEGPGSEYDDIAPWEEAPAAAQSAEVFGVAQEDEGEGCGEALGEANVGSNVEDASAEDDEDAAFEAEFARKLARSRHAAAATVQKFEMTVPAGGPMEEPADGPADEPAEEPADGPAGWHADGPAEEPADGPAEEPADGNPFALALDKELWEPAEPEFFQTRDRLAAQRHEARGRAEEGDGQAESAVSSQLDDDGLSAAAEPEDGASTPSAGVASADIKLEEDDLFGHIPGLEEARTAAQLSDPHIVTVFDCEVHDNVAYIIMEYVEGKTLTSILREAGDGITLDLVAAVVDAIASALEAAQASNVLHLDVKPDNVLVNSQGVVKVTDFGLARLVEGDAPGTTNGGTIGYMPPEQMNLEDLDARTDEWALASIAYEMLSGTNPFIVAELNDAENAILEAELVYPSLCWDELSPKADDIVFKALDPDPEERFGSAGEFADALVPLLGNGEAGVQLLADLVTGQEQEEPEEVEPPVPPEPLVDRIGPWGASLIARVQSAAACALVGATALINVNLGATADAGVYGLATHFPIVFWAAVAACAAAGAAFPPIGAMSVFVLMGIVYVVNGAYLLGLAMVVISILWWRYVGSLGVAQAVCPLLQPLAGSVGMGAFAPVMGGVFLPIVQSMLTALFAGLWAVAFACLGSCALGGWDIFVNLRFSGLDLQAVFMRVATLPQTWCTLISWVLCAGAYSLFCARGTRAFDIMGSVVAAAMLVLGASLGAGLAQAGMADQAASAVAWAMPQPLALASAVVPGLAGILFALLGVPDRARLAPEEWEDAEADSPTNGE